MSLYSRLAEKLQFIAPDFYKKRFFKKLKNLDESNILERKVEPELLWIRNHLHKSDVYLDVGVNVGAYLYRLEDHLKHENIFGFEPNKKLYYRLKRIFPNMRIFRLALSDENTIAEFKVPVLNGKKIHTRGTLHTALREEGETESDLQQVKVIKLDDWAEIEEFRKLDFIKIDVEGNEFQTIKGAEKTIRKFNPTLMVEIEQRHHEEPIWNFISEIEAWGYQANYLNRETLKPEKLTRAFLEKQNSNHVKNYRQYINNIIFVPTK